MTPLEIVFETCTPMRAAPASSATAPPITAWRSVRDPAPTAPPMELAASFAPLLQASRSAPETLIARSVRVAEASFASASPTMTAPERKRKAPKARSTTLPESLGQR